MRARIFSGDNWMGVLVFWEDVEEDEEGRVELRRANEERSSSLRRAIVVRDMVPFEGKSF